MHNMILIDGDRVHHITESLGTKADEILEWHNKMKWKLLDYLTYRHQFIESMKKDTDQKSMMLDELKHYKHAHNEFFKLLKENGDCEEEKIIIESLNTK